MSMKLFIGLGNPDTEYQDTRHNLGWIFLEYLRKQASGDEFGHDSRTGAQTSNIRMTIAGKKVKVLLAKPGSYVNISGPVVGKLKTVYKVKSEDVVLVQDDLDIPFGKVKLSYNKDSAGHRGVESVMKSLKTKKFYRLRLGTANPALAKAHQQNEKTKDESVKKFVLSNFTPAEHKELTAIFQKSLDLLESPGTWPTQ